MSMLSLGPVKVCVLVPSVSTAPAVAPLMFSVARLLLSPDRPVTVVPRLSVIAVPSTPVSAPGDTVGAVGFTVIASVAVVVVLRLPSASCSVAATVSVKLVSLVGVMLRLDRVQLAPSTEGWPVTVVPRLSVIAVPSTPVSATGDTVGAVGFTVIASVAVVGVLRLPSASCSVAATVSVQLVVLVGGMLR